MKIIILVLSVVSPKLVLASFYENCLLIGAVQQEEQTATNSTNELKLIFVATNSYTLSNSHRSCQYWHGREVDISRQFNNLSPFSPGKTIALHYKHESSLCQDGKACGSTHYKLAPYR